MPAGDKLTLSRNRAHAEWLDWEGSQMTRPTRRRALVQLALASGAGPGQRCSGAGRATGEPMPEPGSLERAFQRRPYSPYANRSFATSVYWGDTHLHTGFSMDAGAFGARLTPRDAYRFAKGEELVSATRQPVRLARPLDFLVVADHPDGMGFFARIFAGEAEAMANPDGRRWHNMVRDRGARGYPRSYREGRRRHYPEADRYRAAIQSRISGHRRACASGPTTGPRCCRAGPRSPS